MSKKSWIDTATPNEIFEVMGGIKPMPLSFVDEKDGESGDDDEEEGDSRVDASTLILRDWAKWNAEHPYQKHPRGKKGVVKQSAHRPRKLPEQKWVDPPDPTGKGGRKAGGFTAIGITNTKMGDAVEAALAEHFGMDNEHPTQRQGPLDVRIGTDGYEVKAVSVSATEYKAKPKKHEVQEKLAYAKAHGLDPHVMIVVYSPKEKRIYVYSKPGIGAYRLTTPKAGWTFHGTIPLDLGDNPDPAAVRGAAELLLRDWTEWDEAHKKSPREILDDLDPSGKHPFREYLSTDHAEALKQAMAQWRSSFINSSNMRAHLEGRKMAPGVNQLETAFNARVLGNEVANAPAIGHESWRLENGSAPKVGDIIDHPLISTAADRSEAEGYANSQLGMGSHLLHFPATARGITHSTEVSPKREHIVGGRFRVSAVHDGVVDLEPADERIEPGQLYLRDWTKWDLEHRPLSRAREHIAKHARRFYERGGSIEELNGQVNRDALRHIDRVELVELRKQLEREGKLTPRAEKGIQLAHIAASNGLKNPMAVVRIARTKEGRIAAISTSSSRGSGGFLHHHLDFMGSTGITHGAGSALLHRILTDAKRQHHRLNLVPYDEEAARYWAGKLGAHEDEASGDMGWTPEEVEQMVAA